MADEGQKLKLEVIDGHQQKADPGNVFDDLASLRKASKLTVQRKAVMVNVEVGKPPPNKYFRCHPELVLDNSTIARDQDDSNRSVYFVCPHMRSYPKLMPQLRKVTLVLTCTWPSGNFLIWHVPIFGDRPFPAWKSARAAYELALERWTLMAWAEDKNDYQIEVAEGIDHEPVWPDKSFAELLKLGFDGKIIDNEDHPYVRRLRGLAD
jgi:hypothetical protein